MADKTDKKQNKDHLFKKGQSGNPNGRPLGAKNFTTLFKEAVKKIAEDTGIAPDEIEKDLIIKGITEAKKGKYQYHKDIFDRVYGKPQEKVDITTKGEQVTAINYIIPDGNKP